MDICCACDIDYDYYIDELRCEVRTAAKSHVCAECGEEIKAGEHYEYYVGVSDEYGLEVHKTCWFCMRVVRDFFDCRPGFGVLWNMMEECHGITLYTALHGEDDNDD